MDNPEEALFTVPQGINFKNLGRVTVTAQSKDREAAVPIEGFEDANLPAVVLTNIRRSQYQTPTPVQMYVIPSALDGRDIMACAQTGSGKKAAFLLPIMTNLLNANIGPVLHGNVAEPYVLIVAPTRELVQQIDHEARKFAFGTHVKASCIYGGIGVSIAKMKEGCHILSATPGMLLELLKRQVISLEKVEYFVMYAQPDDSDYMLDRWFQHCISDIPGRFDLPKWRQTFMISDTFPESVQELGSSLLRNFVFITAIPSECNANMQQIW